MAKLKEVVSGKFFKDTNDNFVSNATKLEKASYKQMDWKSVDRSPILGRIIC
jgi:hypothetical protein